MAWEHLELDIALDIASFLDVAHVAVPDVSGLRMERFGPPEIAPDTGFLFMSIGTNWALIKRNRPAELLEQLETATASRPTGPWTAQELLASLGWGGSRGATVSVGMAMTELGWKKKRNWAKGGETNYVK